MNIKVSTRAQQIAPVKESEERGVQDISGRNGLVFFAILYVLKYFSSPERMLTAGEVRGVVADIMSASMTVDGEVISEKTVRRYLNILSGVRPSEEEPWDSRGYEEMILHQMGGSVLSEGKRNKKYCYSCDLDDKDLDLIRIYVTDDAERGSAARIFNEKEETYIRELCDRLSPGIHNKNVTKQMVLGHLEKSFRILEESSKNFESGTSGTEKKGFLSAYRKMHDTIAYNKEALRKGRPPKSLAIRPLMRGDSPAVVMQGENGGPGRFTPKRFLWEKNELYVEGEKPPGKTVSYRLRDLISEI